MGNDKHVLDPRTHNETPQAGSVTEYFSGYVGMLHDALSKVAPEQLEAAYAILKEAHKRHARIYVAGNGGSAAIADHLCCDWMKGTHIPGKPALKVQSMSSNAALLTALANDFGYDDAFSRQLEMIGQQGDVVVLISSSGNSPNVVRAAQTAKARRIKVIGLCGFSGGKLAALADAPVYVPAHNYGVAEDSHQMIMHVLAQFLLRELES